MHWGLEKDQGGTMTARKAYVIGIMAVVVTCLLLLLAIAAVRPAMGQIATMATRPQAPLPTAIWLAECDGWPLRPADLEAEGITVVATRVRRNRAAALLKKGSRRGWVIAHRLGERVSGWWVYAVRGPAAIASLMALAGRCRWVGTWAQAWALTPTVRDWIAERATCCGEAILSGRTFRSWPCSWATERPGLIVVQIDGIGPGVVAGGSACGHVMAQ